LTFSEHIFAKKILYPKIPSPVTLVIAQKVDV